MTLLKENTKVRLKTPGFQVGYISGYGFNKSTTNSPYTVYIIELEYGFYNEAKDMYIGSIICDPSSIEEIK